MNTRLEQDAADTLEAHERREKFRASERARWAKAQPEKLGPNWAPKLTEQEQKELDQYVADNNLPF